MPRINDLRKEVYQKQRKAEAKLNRLEKEKRIRETQRIDPRWHGKRVATASARELQAQIKRLDTFNSRSYQPVGDAKGRPISPSVVREFKREQARLNKWRADYFDSVKTVRMPNGVTVEQASKIRTARHKYQLDDFRESRDRSLHGFTSEQKVREEIKRMKMQNRKAAQGVAKSARDNFKAILSTEHLVEEDWMNRVNKLDDETFMLLWTSTDFKSYIAEKYTMYKKGYVDSVRDMETGFNDGINELIGWAESKKTQQAVNRAKKRRVK